MRWPVEPQGVASRLRGVQGKAVCDRPCGPLDTPRSRGGGATKTACWAGCRVRPPVMYHIHAAARCHQLDPRLCQERRKCGVAFPISLFPSLSLGNSQPTFPMLAGPCHGGQFPSALTSPFQHAATGHGHQVRAGPAGATHAFDRAAHRPGLTRAQRSVSELPWQWCRIGHSALDRSAGLRSTNLRSGR